MIQLALIALCSIGCLIALVSAISSLIDSLRRAGQGKPHKRGLKQQIGLPAGYIWPLTRDAVLNDNRKCRWRQ